MCVGFFLLFFFCVFLVVVFVLLQKPCLSEGLVLVNQTGCFLAFVVVVVLVSLFFLSFFFIQLSELFIFSPMIFYVLSVPLLQIAFYCNFVFNCKKKL